VSTEPPLKPVLRCPSAGGTINLTVVHFEGRGALSAEGGSGIASPCSGAAGGGGLIRVAYEESSFSGTFRISGGAGIGSAGDSQAGGVGSAFLVDQRADAVFIAAGEYPLRSGEALQPALTARRCRAAHRGRRCGGGAHRHSAWLARQLEYSAGAQRAHARASRARAAPRREQRLRGPRPRPRIGQRARGQRALRADEPRGQGWRYHHPRFQASRAMHLVATNAVRIAVGARIDASGRGLVSWSTVEPSSGLIVGGSEWGNGGSHGGAGGGASHPPRCWLPATTTRRRLGAPAEAAVRRGNSIYYPGGSGGGVLRVTAASLVVDGAIIADGVAPVLPKRERIRRWRRRRQHRAAGPGASWRRPHRGRGGGARWRPRSGRWGWGWPRPHRGDRECLHGTSGGRGRQRLRARRSREGHGDDGGRGCCPPSPRRLRCAPRCSAPSTTGLRPSGRSRSRGAWSRAQAGRPSTQPRAPSAGRRRRWGASPSRSWPRTPSAPTGQDFEVEVAESGGDGGLWAPRFLGHPQHVGHVRRALPL
jgi:hypothetical protein